jgi:chromosome partitioning protein
VLLIDADPQGNATSGAGIKQGIPGIYEVLLGDLTPTQGYYETTLKNWFIMPSGIQLAGAEVELIASTDREYILKNQIEWILNIFDYIFIDCPPSLGLITLNALTAANTVLIPIQCEYYALEGLSQLMNTIKLVKRRLNSGIDIEGVVLTMLDSRTNLGVQVAEEIRKYFKDKTYETVIPRNVKLGEAPSHGEPIHIYDPKSAGAEAYLALAKEFIRWNGGVEN